jgi:hypothetical protein
MALSVKKETRSRKIDVDAMYLSLFPANGLLETTEQIRRFELLRLAFFVLKQRKLERDESQEQEQGREQGYKLSLLRHAIFQQVLTLIALDARSQAMQIIEACQS